MAFSKIIPHSFARFVYRVTAARRSHPIDDPHNLLTLTSRLRHLRQTRILIAHPTTVAPSLLSSMTGIARNLTDS